MIKCSSNYVSKLKLKLKGKMLKNNLNWILNWKREFKNTLEILEFLSFTIIFLSTSFELQMKSNKKGSR